MVSTSFSSDVDVSLVGEIETRRELAAEGWLTINTNTEKGNFPNVDLIAIKGNIARGIQVKTTNAESGSHRDYLFLGRGERWLMDQTPFFNSKSGPMKASVVVLVHAKRKGSRFVVLPVGLAEVLARLDVEQWYDTRKKDGTSRSAGFDARIPFARIKRAPRKHDLLLCQTLHDFEDRWDILLRSEADLNTPNGWNFSVTRQ